MLVLAFGTIFLTKEKELNQIEPDELMREIIQPTRYVSTDQIARMIIKKDPSLMLVDVRSEDEFLEFSLPGAINVPLDSLIKPENLSYFGMPGTKVVFISNDDIKADQTWMLTK
jgi:3-mercaptopyruvate sulfurtransferase SseA